MQDNPNGLKIHDPEEAIGMTWRETLTDALAIGLVGSLGIAIICALLGFAVWCIRAGFGI